jgi:2,4-dienoyl-CoA reductase-like NADH-dependent reductase (Old Yellow Enzyme family)
VSKLFSPLTLRGLTLKNRIVMSPMAMFCASAGGVPTEFHRMHYGTRAVGGTGLLVQEVTAVEARGRISTGDLGLWEDAQMAPLKQIVDFAHAQGAKMGVQLGHAGRKTWSADKARGATPVIGPSALPFDADWAVPEALTIAEMDGIVTAFATAAKRVLAVGYDVIEIHSAHGYLLHEFLSPISNQRADAYGGSLENRARLLRRVVQAVRGVWPLDKPLFVRVSASDWAPGGLDIGQTVQVARWLKDDGVDLLDCSSGGNVPAAPPLGPGYQVPFAQQVRKETGLPTAAVGLITTPEMAEEIVFNQRADLVFLGRELLRNPYWPLQAARALGVELEWPVQYKRAKL